MARRWSDDIARAHWSDIERLLADHYRGEGWEVDHCGTGGRVARFDGGIDLKLRRRDEYVVVQCKHWNARQVPHNAVHELLGVMHTEGATGAIIVASGEFTLAAMRAAGKASNLRLVDGVELRAMLRGRLPASSPALAAEEGGRWEPLLDLVERVATQGLAPSRRGHGPRHATQAFGAFLAVKVGGFVLLIGAALVAYAVIVGAIDDLGDRQAARLRAPTSTAPVAPGSASPSSSPTPAMPARPAPVDPAEWQRRNDEAMRVLAQSTPEVARLPSDEEVEAARRRNDTAQ